MSLLLVSCSLALAADPAPHTEVGLGPALVYAPFREAQVGPRREGGGTGGVVLSLDVVEAKRYDRATFFFTSGQRSGWRWRGGHVRVTIAPDIADLGPLKLRVGAEGEFGLMVREWRDNAGWRSQFTLGPAVALHWPLSDGRSRWSADLVGSAPLIGLLARPGFANAFQDRSLSGEDVTFASLHRHRAGQLLVALTWQREGRATIRFQAELGGRVITWRHRLAEVNHVLSTLLYWRL